MWYSVQVFYYDEETDHLLVHGVRPVVEELRRTGAIDRFYMHLHWKFGPHVQLNFATDETRFTEQVWPLVERRLEEYLAQHPSTLVLDEQAYEAESSDLGHTELDPGPYLPLQPNNSIRIAPYALRADHYSGPEGAALAEQFLSQAMDPVFDALAIGLHGSGHRLKAALRMMVGTAGCRLNLKGSFLCFRSHHEGFLGGVDSTGELRQEFDAWYHEHRTELGQVVRQAADQLLGVTERDSFYQYWVPMVHEIQERFERLFTAGEARPIGYHDFVAKAQEVDKGMSDQWSETPSDFHRFMYSNQEIKQFNESPKREAFRYVINLTYTTLILLGISPFERYLLCYMISHELEEYFGMSWQEIVEEAMAQRAAKGSSVADVGVN